LNLVSKTAKLSVMLVKKRLKNLKVAKPLESESTLFLCGKCGRENGYVSALSSREYVKKA
jgi:hypothetical protein